MSEPSPPAVRVAAPAKVNLSLHVTGRRDDGYHTLDSLVAFAGVFDRVRLDPADGLSLSVVGPYAAKLSAEVAPEQNIVMRAAAALAARTGCTKGARITLHKSLPLAAGVGGGSADAAAVLRGLTRLWQVGLTDAELREVGAELGADVPVCLRARAALVSGIGEVLHEAPRLPAAWLVLANPGVALSTPEVFQARTGPFSPPAPLEDAPRDADALADALRQGRRNDLTAAAISLAPEVGQTLAALQVLPGCLLARMSGSGATCWGLFATEYAARSAAKALRLDHPGWWIEPAPLLAEVDPFALAESPSLQR